MEIKFEKQFTNDNKISACYVVDQMREILNIKELEKLQLAIHEFKNDLIHDMGVNQMCQQLTKEEKENANRTRSQQ
jgi:hypothetical protein